MQDQRRCTEGLICARDVYQINEKYKILKKGQTVVDLVRVHRLLHFLEALIPNTVLKGYAPGSWTEVSGIASPATSAASHPLTYRHDRLRSTEPHPMDASWGSISFQPSLPKGHRPSKATSCRRPCKRRSNTFYATRTAADHVSNASSWTKTRMRARPGA